MRTMGEACIALIRIARTSGRNDKMEILKSQASDALKFLLETALNPYLNYGVYDFNDGRVYRTDFPNLEELRSLREALVSKQVTGDKAKELLRKTILIPESTDRDILVSVFQKELRIGAAGDTINKVFPGLIPEFKLQLCESIEERKIEGNWIAEPKLDGLRCVMIFRNHECDVLSRNGKPLYNLGHIVALLRPQIKDGVVDGEVFSTNWNESDSIVRSSKAVKGSENLKFYVFDFIPLDEWDAKVGHMPLCDRKTVLRKLVPDNTPSIVKVSYLPINNTEGAWQAAKEYKKEGYEGAVVKNMDTPYTFDRGHEWMKLKFEETDDLLIVGYEEGVGRNLKKLGAFVCRLPNGNTVQVGGGFSDEQRVGFWNQKKGLIGRTVEVKFQERTKDGSLRFPVFVRFRNDK